MHRSGMSKFWEFLAILVIGSIILQAVLSFILPLIPYMIGALVLFGIGAVVYRRRRSW